MGGSKSFSIKCMRIAVLLWRADLRWILGEVLYTLSHWRSLYQLYSDRLLFHVMYLVSALVLTAKAMLKAMFTMVCGCVNSQPHYNY